MESYHRTYSNPILRGFFPDPSIVRVGDDYYMVNSTFEYFPAIVISHSRDLIHWEIIGHGVTRNDYLDFFGLEDSHGMWAPDISYHDGVFYIMATLRLNGGADEAGSKVIRRQMVIRSDKPEGPYSKPVFIEVGGIDPSHFVDDDGSHYMLVNSAARLVKLNTDCTAAVAEPVTIWAGTGARCPEGPHLLKHKGYYYIILAEGGTGYGHRVSVARSRELYGPYESSPHNPVLTQTDPQARIQRAGHGKLVQTPEGDWWMVYLCGRPNEGNFTTLGRETSLDPVTWTTDGWFVVNDGHGPSNIQIAPRLAEFKYNPRYFDDFDQSRLDLNWQFVRNPDHDTWSLTKRSGYLRLYTGNAPLGSIYARNVLVRREQHFQYQAVTKLEFSPCCNGEEAGLTCYYNSHCFIKLSVIYDNGLKIRLIENRNDSFTCLGEVENVHENTLFLKTVVDKQRRKFYYSCDNQSWHGIGMVIDASFLCDEGVQLGKHHTGTMVGLYATNAGTGARIAADFDWFDYTPLDID